MVAQGSSKVHSAIQLNRRAGLTRSMTRHRWNVTVLAAVSVTTDFREVRGW